MPDAVITAGKERISVKSTFRFKDICKSVNGGRWNPKSKTWEYPASPATAREIHRAFGDIGCIFNGEFERLLKQSFAVAKAAEKKTAKELPDYETATTPWLHQKQAYWFSHDLDAVMLAMEMGCGKSKVVVDLCMNKGFKRILIACPLSVVGVWPREFQTHTHRQVEVIPLTDGTVTQRTIEARKHLGIAAAKQRPAVVVVNHEALWRKPFGEFAKEAGFDCLVVDESHRSKQHDGQLSLYLNDLAKHIPVRYALTGSPMPHSPLDIFAQYRFLDPGIFGPSWFRFKNRYCVMGGFQNKQIVRFTDLDDLNDRFYRIAYRVTKDEALDLPEEMHEIRSCILEPKAMAIYDALQKQFYAKVKTGEITVANALVELLRLQQLTGGHIKTDEGHVERLSTAKADLLAEILEDIAEPVVVFAQFHEDLDRISEIAEKMGRRYGEISGRRKDLTPHAKMPDDIDVMGVQIHAGGVGIDLTRSRYGIYWSTGFNMGDYIQSLSRLHRPGQKHKVLFIHLLAKGTVDDKVFSALKSRRNIVESCLERTDEQE